MISRSSVAVHECRSPQIARKTMVKSILNFIGLFRGAQQRVVELAPEDDGDGGTLAFLLNFMKIPGKFPSKLYILKNVNLTV